MGKLYAITLPENTLPVWQQIQQIQSLSDADLTPRFYQWIAFPGNAETNTLLDDLDAVERRLESLPDPLETPIWCAEKSRRISMAALMQARIWDERKSHDLLPPAVDINPALRVIAAKARDAAKAGLDWVAKASGSSQTPEMLEKIRASEIQPHLLAIEATAFGILYSIDWKSEDREAAREMWNKIATISPSYQAKWSPVAPELEKALGISDHRGNDPKMTPIAWTGIALVAVCLILAFAFKNNTSLQVFAVRVALSLGATLIATVVSGFLEVKIPGYVMAGGTLAIFALTYLFNPPKLDSEQLISTPPPAGSPPPKDGGAT